jgi:uncharacterized repeat protein (TIGR01451 family)
MKAYYPLVGGAILAACLAGWVALAWGQPSTSKQPPSVPAMAPAPAEAPPPLPQTAASMPEPPPPSKAVMEALGVAPPATPLPPPPIMPPPGALPPAPPIAPFVPNPAQPVPLPPSGIMQTKLEANTAPPVAENTMGKQEPAVSLEWVGPALAKIGAATEYVLVVRNTGNVAVHDVEARVVLPAGFRLLSSEPHAEANGRWAFGVLEAKQEKTVQIKLVAETRGELTPQVFVHFASVASMRVRVCEPKLTVKTSAPEKVTVKEAVPFTVTVTNPGDGNADQVKIHALLSEGLENVRGAMVDFDIGSLGSGEARTVQIMCQAKAGGMQVCKTTVEGDGLSATDSASVNVVMPRLDLQVVGPGLRYLERKALYTVKITNPGDAPATNVTVGDVVPAGFKVLAASNGGRYDANTRMASWFVGEIAPGQTHEVQLEVMAVNPGRFTHKASAVGDRNLRAEGEFTTSVEGLSALGVELVDTEDPVEVSGETAYEVRINNTGSKTETDIKLIAEVPPQMQFKSATGPAHYTVEGNKITFEPVDKLAPRAEAMFRINVKAIEQGTVRFKIQVTSTNLVDPVIKMEATRIYSDAPDMK